MRKIWRVVVLGTWPYWVGAVILALLNILLLLVRQRPWGITANIEDWTHWMGTWLSKGAGAQQIHDLPHYGGTILNIGIILGSVWASLVAAQLRWRPIKNMRQTFLAITGGFLVGYGARIAYGCNIGQLLNGIASNSLAGWLFAAAVLAGAWLGGKILIKLLL